MCDAAMSRASVWKKNNLRLAVIIFKPFHLYVVFKLIKIFRNKVSTIGLGSKMMAVSAKRLPLIVWENFWKQEHTDEQLKLRTLSI